MGAVRPQAESERGCIEAAFARRLKAGGKRARILAEAGTRRAHARTLDSISPMRLA
jgi:hypothetical protein